MDLLAELPSMLSLLASSAGPEGGATTTAAAPPLFSAASLLALLTLTLLEIVLGIDNVVFISIFWIMKLTRPLFTIPAFWTGADGDGIPISGKSLILIIGGLFLLWKSTHEIHHKLEGEEHGEGATVTGQVAKSFGTVLVQILLIDIVFSLDSVITAVGMAQHIEIMIAAVIVSVGVMMVFSGPIARVINRHPTLQMLALSFLLLIGVMLVVEGFGGHIAKGYIYFAMAFSVAVEMLNLRARKKAEPVQLRHSGYGT